MCRITDNMESGHSCPESQGAFVQVQTEGQQQSQSAVALPEEQHPKKEVRRSGCYHYSLIWGMRARRKGGLRGDEEHTMHALSMLQSSSLCKRHWEAPGFEWQPPPTESLQGSRVCPGRMGNNPWKEAGSSCGLYLVWRPDLTGKRK